METAQTGSSGNKKMVDLSSNYHNRIKIGFLRVVDFPVPIGKADWRIAFYFSEIGFDSWIFGRGDPTTVVDPRVHFVSMNAPKIPILGAIILGVYYALQAVRADFDVIVCNPGIFFAMPIIKLCRPCVKVILDIRSIPVEVSKYEEVVQNINYLMIFKSRLYDAVSMITDGMMDELDQKYRFKTKVPTIVWESAYDDEIFSPSNVGNARGEKIIPDKGLTIMYHGSLSVHRGLFEAVRAMRVLKDANFKDVSLVFVGKGPATEELHKLVNKLEIGDCVSILPAIPLHDLPEMIASASLGIDPLPDHPWWRNQSSLKVYEYLAMGKPVLATDLPCHRGLSESILLIPDNSPETIANAIIQFRDLPPEKRAYLQKAALRDVQKHTWRARARTFADFIRSEVM